MSHIQPAKNKDGIVKQLAEKKAVVVGMDTIPRQLRYGHGMRGGAVG